MATDDKELQERAFRAAVDYAGQADWSVSIPEFGTKIHEIIKLETGNRDPYAEMKELQNKIGLRLYEKLRSEVEVAEDPLYLSAKIAIAGNIIDPAPENRADMNSTIRGCLEEPIDIDNFELFREEIGKTSQLLYLADNAGEVFFDRIFIEELVSRDLGVIYAVKGGPILNDATLKDAKIAKIDEIAKVISNGAPAIGTQLDRCSPKFREVFEGTDLIISKGQGNYESIGEMNRNIFFVLKAKCPVIARALDVPLGTTIFTSTCRGAKTSP